MAIAEQGDGLHETIIAPRCLTMRRKGIFHADAITTVREEMMARYQAAIQREHT